MKSDDKKNSVDTKAQECARGFNGGLHDTSSCKDTKKQAEVSKKSVEDDIPKHKFHLGED